MQKQRKTVPDSEIFNQYYQFKNYTGMNKFLKDRILINTVEMKEGVILQARKKKSDLQIN